MIIQQENSGIHDFDSETDYDIRVSTCRNDPYEATTEGDGIFKCICPLNYTGQHCEIEIGIDLKCDESPCQNDGFCDNRVRNKETGEDVNPARFSLWDWGLDKNESYCKDYECESYYSCICSHPWEGENCEIFKGNPCQKEMVTFEDQQSCMNFLFEKIEKIGNGKFTHEMKRSIKQQIKKKTGKNDKN